MVCIGNHGCGGFCTEVQLWPCQIRDAVEKAEAYNTADAISDVYLKWYTKAKEELRQERTKGRSGSPDGAYL